MMLQFQMKPLLSVFIALACFLYEVRSANILIYMGMSSPSHKFAFLPYAEELVNRGHQVTFVSPFLTKNAKFRDISPPLMQEAASLCMDGNYVDFRLNNDVINFAKLIPLSSVSICEAVMKSPELKNIVLGKEKFDLIIIDPLANECGLGFGHVNKAPIVYFHTAGYYPWTATALGIPSAAVYSTTYFVFNTNDFTKLTTRALTTVTNLLFDYLRRWNVFPTVENMWSQRLGYLVPSFADMERNVSLYLLNTHYAVEFPIPYMHNAISVGGIHLQPHNPLPEDLENIASGSGKEGFIVFSLGSMVQAKTLPRIYYLAFLEAFRRLPQRVIWKWESDDHQETLPANVFTRKWIPQYDLLAHPKCRGFVTHGGKLGTIEAIQEGIPVVVIPFFTDQDLHGTLAQREGSGIFMDLSDVSADTLFQAISNITLDAKFKKRAMERSKIFRDQPDTPLSRAIFWTEFVLRHPQGLPLRTEAKYFTWYQYHMVDVWILVACIVLVPIIGMHLLIRFTWRLVRPNSTKSKIKIKLS